MELTIEQQWFLAALRSYINPGEGEIDFSEKSVGRLSEVYRLSYIHSVLPMVYEAAAKLRHNNAGFEKLLKTWRHDSLHIVCAQTVKTQAFLQLYRGFNQAGIKALVTKGILCRELYPFPDVRTSSDEDILADEKDFPAIDRVMAANGMELAQPQDGQARKTAQVLTYFNPQNGLRIELHSHLFSPDSDAYGGLDALFADSLKNAVRMNVSDVKIWSMTCTDHMLYLLFHAFKHFLHGGFGVRQTCDINIFAKTYDEKIDWGYVSRVLAENRADCFAASVFKIGCQYLGFPCKKYIPADAPEVEELLVDILVGGVYGSSSEERKHSSLITLSALASPGSGDKTHVAKTLFPSAKQLSGRYGYLNKKPWLLPVAWTQRIATYCKNDKSSASRSVDIGKKRVELMRKYKIIGKRKK